MWGHVAGHCKIEVSIQEHFEEPLLIVIGNICIGNTISNINASDAKWGSAQSRSSIYMQNPTFLANQLYGKQRMALHLT